TMQGTRIEARLLAFADDPGRFFFSSRRRHTRLQGDWSSDVCSSDLDLQLFQVERVVDARLLLEELQIAREGVSGARDALGGDGRSEERRVGKECRDGWGPDGEREERATKLAGVEAIGRCAV